MKTWTAACKQSAILRVGVAEILKLLPWVIIFALLGAIGFRLYSNYSPSPSSSVVSTPSRPQTISGRASVIDGDTIEIHSERIRLFGIDAPENGQSCTIQGKASRVGQAAAFALADKIGGQVVECRPKDRDRFNRRVDVCFAGGEDINGWMVANGWALAYRYYSRDYVSQEEQASQRKLGIWQCNDFVAPWDWRRNNFQRPKNESVRPRVHQYVYYRPGDLSGTSYATLENVSGQYNVPETSKFA